MSKDYGRRKKILAVFEEHFDNYIFSNTGTECHAGKTQDDFRIQVKGVIPYARCVSERELENVCDQSFCKIIPSKGSHHDYLLDAEKDFEIDMHLCEDKHAIEFIVTCFLKNDYKMTKLINLCHRVNNVLDGDVNYTKYVLLRDLVRVKPTLAA